MTQVIGLRFAGVAIPRGAVITSAHLQFTTEKATTGPAQLAIGGEASDNATAFGTTLRNISYRADTTASVAWSPAPWTLAGQAGPDQRTPSLSGIVQEITSRPGWNAGNAMVFAITGTGTRTATSYNKNRQRAPKLIVTYYLP